MFGWAVKTHCTGWPARVSCACFGRTLRACPTSSVLASLGVELADREPRRVLHADFSSVDPLGDFGAVVSAWSRLAPTNSASQRAATHAIGDDFPRRAVC